MADETKQAPELKGDALKIAEMLEKMTVLEVSDLVKALEVKFRCISSSTSCSSSSSSSSSRGSRRKKHLSM